MGPKAYKIGICVRYDKEVYALAFVNFSMKGDVVVSGPTEDYRKLKSGAKFDPHATYHVDGVNHTVRYRGAKHLPRDIIYFGEKTKQPLDATFTGYETVDVQGFGRDHAKGFAHTCIGCDLTLEINSESIREKFDVMSDHLGEVRTKLPTVCLQVDLVEPNRYDVVGTTVVNPKRTIEQKLICDTFPWCLITVFDSSG